MGVMNSGVNAYRQTTVRTASGGRLIVMLYDEAVKQLDIAVELLDKKTKKLDQVHNALIKTQDILTELMTGLDFDKGGEIAQNLMNIYLYLYEKIKEGNLKKDIAPLTEARSHMSELRSAWAQIVGRAEAASPAASQGVNIAG